MRGIWRSVVVVVVALTATAVVGQNLKDLIRREPMVSEFLSRIPKTLGQAMLESKSVTALVPTNEAVRRFEERKRQEGHDLNVVWSQIYQYHFLNLPLTASDLQEEVLTELRGNYPVYVTRTEHHDRRQSTIYLNNARLLRHDIRGSVKDDLGMQEPQVMHIIDEVLEPIVPRIRNNKAPEASLFNPSAWELLDKSSEYNLALTKWRGIVMERNMQDWYSGSELKTYFIPIDAGNRIEKGRLDDLALAGHVIPGQVLFTRTLNSGSTHGQAVKFESGVAELVASDKYQGRARNQAPKLKVMLSVKNITSPDANRKMHTLLFAQSHTVVGDQLRKEGTVMVEIERANIPVKNGVVHLIKRPLLTVDETLTQLIEGNPDLKKFAELLKTQAPTTWNAILRANEGTTVLAPSDEAFNRMGRQTYTNLVSNRKRFEQIASYHVVLEKFSIKNALNIKKSATQDDEIIDENEDRLSIEVRSASPDVSVWFHAFGPPDNVTLSVDAAGVNASIVSPDLAASNGILYVIDHVLGIPYQNVFKKLSTDPMMKITYDLGTQRNFNEQMEDDKKKFTFFVPSNEAWEKQQSKNPSAMKKIMMGAFPGNTKMILERHLMANEAMELEEMVKQGKVQMARGGTIQVTKDNGAKNRNKVAPQANNKGKPESGTRYLVEWDGIVAEVERGDIECTNGYIHVIRDVLMKDKDVQVNTAAVPVGATSGFLSFTLLSFLAAKLLSL